MKVQFWFPTPIYVSELSNASELNKYLLKHILQWKKQDKGLKKTNIKGWHSETNMHVKKEYEPLVKEINRMQVEINKNECYTRPTFIGNMWANINYPGSSNVAHIHSNAHWSGVYYIQAPKQSGVLQIEDPRQSANMFTALQLPTPQLPRRLWKLIHFNPVAGKLLMFPAYLVHAVSENLSKLKGPKGWRFSVSFNLVQETIEA